MRYAGQAHDPRIGVPARERRRPGRIGPGRAAKNADAARGTSFARSGWALRLREAASFRQPGGDQPIVPPAVIRRSPVDPAAQDLGSEGLGSGVSLRR